MRLAEGEAAGHGADGAGDCCAATWKAQTKSAAPKKQGPNFAALAARVRAGCGGLAGHMNWGEGKVEAQKDGQWIIHELY